MHPSIREINVNKEVLAIKRPLSEKTCISYATA